MFNFNLSKQTAFNTYLFPSADKSGMQANVSLNNLLKKDSM